MPATEAEAAQRLASRVHLMAHESDDSPRAARTIEEAVVASRVVDIEYKDSDGAVTHRAVEPIALVGSSEAWYLFAYCRLRDDVRFFRVDRVATAQLTNQRAPEREYTIPEIPTTRVRRLSLLE
jgi:predicted DNA-binding transcriptional regulator YafY